MSQLSRFRATVPVAFVVFSILLVSLLLIQADNSRGEEVLAKLEYEIFDDSGETKAMVVNCTNKEEATKATIDAQYNGYDVVAVGGYAFSGCTSLASVDMPNVTTIGSYAFYGCTSLASVEMSNVTTIGSYAFYGCTSLASVNMPKVTSIGEGTFRDCTSLKHISLPRVTSIGPYAFRDCFNLKSATFEKKPVHELGESRMGYEGSETQRDIH